MSQLDGPAESAATPPSRSEMPPAPPTGEPPTPPVPRADHDVDATVDELAEAVRRRPDDAHARLAFGSALAARGNLDPAIREVREGLRQLERERASDDPRAQARLDLDAGQAQLGRGDMAGAVRSLRSALARAPDLVPARVSLGLALQGMGHVDAAIDEFRAALRQAPDSAEARMGLAAVLVARQDWTGARAELEHVLRLEPDQLQALSTLGVVRYAVGDLHGAVDAYRRVLARQPERHDARYGLAVMLKLARRDAEATQEFLAAAHGGVPKAQYFAGTAYAAGAGVERDLAMAIAWWFRAAEQGVAQAEEALAQLRQTALGKGRRGVPDQREVVRQAFAEFRAGLWAAFPGLGPTAEDGPGTALLRVGRVGEAVPVLIREALAFGDRAQALLEALYAEGVDDQLAAYDPRILGYFRTAAGEGDVRARLALARIHGWGLGVPQDLAAAQTLLRATPHEDAQRLLQELSASNGLGPARP